jgi:phage terminase large subunit GpA-like protein
VSKVVLVFGTQLGKTEFLLNWIGYSIDHSPAPFMLVLPRSDDCRTVSRQRIDPMIESSPRLRGHVSERRSRDSGNTQTQKDFDGGMLLIRGANSAADLRSSPIKNLACDEVDAYPEDVDEEGDPVSLAERRTTNFPGRKIALTSTPTIEGHSRIVKEYDETDQSEYFVPCPHCRVFQTLQWPRIKWEEDRPETAQLVCEACGVLVPEHHKEEMLLQGEWRAQLPERSERARGFRLSSLYSPWVTWAECVRHFLKAKRAGPAQLKVFINTVLAQTWKGQGDAPEWRRLYDRREQYKIGTVPAGGLVLTAGVDVQKTRLELEVVAWGRGLESWSVDYRVFEGDTGDPATWLALSQALSTSYRHENGLDLNIRLMAVDSGYNTQHVYSWVRRQTRGHVIAVKGDSDGRAAALVQQPKAVDLNADGKRARRGMRVYIVSGDVAKTQLYGWLRLDRPTTNLLPCPPGYCHFPEYGPEFFKQLVSEQVELQIVRGYRRYRWVLMGDRNEALDCRVYARAAANVLGLDRYQDVHWAQLETALGAPKPPPPTPPKKKPRADRGEDEDYLSRWR